ncbi:uncharacterized protein [Littorina saxatilis]|uniref:uncharacterized protein n=1 Tax=Littorina saxatilis TaxID=31220 RepID=UPI0038B5BB15
MELEGESDATASVQAMERLHLTARSFSDTERNLMLKEKIRSALDQLREVKALVEGSHDTFVPLSINEQPLLELKQLLLMHVPSSITDEARQRFFMLIDQALGDRCKKIVAGVVLTCPWYAATQKERGEQAKHNMLLVVVMNDDRQFFSPANLQTKEAGGVVDLGWLSVVELFHFGRFLVKGRTRYVETAFCDKDALVYSSDEWQHLRDQLSVNTVTGLRPFQEACCGQAMGSVAKKRQNGGMKLKESATLAEICEAFRLLNHAHNHHDNRPPVTNGLHPSSLPETALQALEKLKALYKAETPRGIPSTSSPCPDSLVVSSPGTPRTCSCSSTQSEMSSKARASGVSAMKTLRAGSRGKKSSATADVLHGPLWRCDPKRVFTDNTIP